VSWRFVDVGDHLVMWIRICEHEREEVG
jgi:hypothetical protein